MNIDDLIFKQRELCADSDIEIRRIKQALAIAESIADGRYGALEELLELRNKQLENEINSRETAQIIVDGFNKLTGGNAKLASTKPMTAQEHNAFPAGRWT